MALTNFAALTNEELTVWSRDTWYAARNMQFLNQFTGTGADSMIQRITELTASKKGARAVITLVKDLEGDGVAGDRTLEGNEEALVSDEMVIRIDQLRHANRHQGRMADQKSVVNFRKNSKSVLAYWLADRMDQIAFLMLSGLALTNKTNGATRVGSDLPLLDFAADAAADTPTANRHFQWDATNGLLKNGDAGFGTANIVGADYLSWATLIELKAQAQERFVKPIRMNNGVEYYNIFVTPTTMSKLKQDPDFLANIRSAGPRGMDGPLFKGAETYYVDGMAIHSFRHVYNTRGLASGSKWGGGTVDGSRVIMAGAQALGFADIGNAEWVEKEFDYDNQPGISYGKIMGFKKPKFESLESGTTEDFGVIVCDVAQ